VGEYIVVLKSTLQNHPTVFQKSDPINVVIHTSDVPSAEAKP